MITLNQNQKATLQAVLKDAAGNVLGPAPVVWVSNNPDLSAVPSADTQRCDVEVLGNVAPSKGTITATIGSLPPATIDVIVTGPAATVEIVAGEPTAKA